MSDYEIVAAQAIKNIRHLDKAKLIERLEKSSDNQIAKATWEDGKLVGNRARLIDALKKASENLTRVVTILQPRLTRREIETLRKAAKTEKRAIQFNQLNALMLGTRQAVASSGAEFTAIADGQGSSGASS